MAESGDLSTRLRAVRHQRGLSLRAVAERTGVSAPAVFQWERGTTPRKEHLEALADALLVSPEYLVSGDENDAWSTWIEEAVLQAKHTLSERTGVDPEQINVTIDLKCNRPGLP